MWIHKEEYYRLRDAMAETSTLKARVASQQTTLEWLMMRLTQLEHERAKLIETYMGVKIPVPEVGTPAPRDAVDQILRDPGTLFQDVGDDEAEKQGIGWDPETGRLVYDRK